MNQEDAQTDLNDNVSIGTGEAEKGLARHRRLSKRYEPFSVSEPGLSLNSLTEGLERAIVNTRPYPNLKNAVRRGSCLGVGHEVPAQFRNQLQQRRLLKPDSHKRTQDLVIVLTLAQ